MHSASRMKNIEATPDLIYAKELMQELVSILAVKNYPIK